MYRKKCHLAQTDPVLETGGKPSTWFPPGRLVEQRSPQTDKHRNKNERTEARRNAKAKQNHKNTISKKHKIRQSKQTTKTSKNELTKQNKTQERIRKSNAQEQNKVKSNIVNSIYPFTSLI